jgi:hypothetical protein
VTTGGLKTRLERLREICKYETALKNLRFCWQEHANGKNCGRCRKCIMTRMQLIACGIDPKPLFEVEIDREAMIAILWPFGNHTRIYLNDIRDHLPVDHDIYVLLSDLLSRPHNITVAPLSSESADSRHKKRKLLRPLKSWIRTLDRRGR